MSKTRLKALLRQVESGQAKSDMARILKYIIDNNVTNRQLISDGMGIKLQTVVARVSDLLDMGVIEVKQVSKNHGFTHEVLTHQPDPMRQVQNAYERKKEKFAQWKKRGEREFSDFLDLSQLELKLK